MISQPLGKIDCYGITRKHPRFRRNSDRFVIADVRPSLCIHHSTETPESENARFFGDSQGQLLVVADGVGDRKSAARASALAIETVNSHLLNAFSAPSSEPEFDEPDLFEEFKQAIRECRDAMQREVDAANRFDEMGAVLTLVYVAWPDAYIMHVGNNRAYHWQRQTMDQLTKDHTMARRLVDAGQLSPRQAKQSTLRKVLWNLVGTQTDETAAECKEIELCVGDAIVLCSDGMTAALEERQITEALEETDSAEATCEAILSTAARNGLEDDATVVVARFADRDDAARLSGASAEASRPTSQTQSDPSTDSRSPVVQTARPATAELR